MSRKRDRVSREMVNALAIDVDFCRDGGIEVRTLIDTCAIILPEYTKNCQLSAMALLSMD